MSNEAFVSEVLPASNERSFLSIFKSTIPFTLIPMRQLLTGIAVLSLVSIAYQGRADDLDEFIRKQMQKRHVPGLSIAIIEDGKLIKAKGYGWFH